MAYYTVYFPQPGRRPLQRLPGEPLIDGEGTLTLPDGEKKLHKGEYAKIKRFDGDPPPTPSGRGSVIRRPGKPSKINKARGYGENNTT